tara:strand:- start:20625 stop:21170 length:546 start_codon:yes stop_codon:yes gene_type:complete
VLYGIAEMKKVIYIGISTATFVALFYVVPLFYIGLEFLLLPFMLIVLTAGIVGVVTIPLTAYKVYKSQRISNWLNWLNGLAIGAYFGYLITIPILDWDEEQRNLSGILVSEHLEEYRNKNGTYPTELSDLQVAQLNKKLPNTYQLDRFSYFVKENEYALDIPIPITDRWHWNREEQKWEYE